jgi:hypothetical protein
MNDVMRPLENKNPYVYLLILSLLPFLFSCGTENIQMNNSDGQPRSALIIKRDNKCTKLSEPDNFEAHGDDVYDDKKLIIGKPTLQIGALNKAHTQELIVNLSNTDDNFQSGNYPLTPGGSNRAWIIFQPTNSSEKEYASIEGGGAVKVNKIQLNATGGIFELDMEFDDIKVHHNGDTLCLSGEFDILVKTQ